MDDFCVLLPFHQIGRSLERTLAGLLAQSHRSWRCFLIDKRLDPGNRRPFPRPGADERIRIREGSCESTARLMNWAAQDGGGRYLVRLAEGVLLHPDAFAKWFALFAARPEAAVAFSSYRILHPDGSERCVRLHPHEGNLHERFPFGFVKVWDAAKLRGIGGYRTDLLHAAEYDVHLKLGDAFTHEWVDEPLYSVQYANSPGLLLQSLHHKPYQKYGGFSYLFYPPDIERETAQVFGHMLERRGALLDLHPLPVPYPDHPYPVAATVVIPVLDRVDYIAACLESVLTGTFRDFEVIVVDNGSQDGTLEWVAALAERDARVRLIRNNGPVASALNAAIHSARGKYICHLDSDDEYVPESLERMVSCLESNPGWGLAVSSYVLMDEAGKNLEGFPVISHGVYSPNQILRHDGMGQLRAVPRIVLEEMGGYDESFGSYGEDHDLVLRISEKYEIGLVPEVLYRCRRHAGNTEHVIDPFLRMRNKNQAALNALKRRQAINRSRKSLNP